MKNKKLRGNNARPAFQPTTSAWRPSPATESAGRPIPPVRRGRAHQPVTAESASRPLVDFSVLNDNLIKGLILCVKCLSIISIKYKIFIDTPLEV
jgi:hypothetical protein